MSESNTLFKYFLSQHPLYQQLKNVMIEKSRILIITMIFSARGMVEWWITKQSSRSYSELIQTRIIY